MMYVPPHFRESDVNRIHAFIDAHRFGILVSQVKNLPFATHLPLLLDRNTGPFGTLIGHTARANPQCEQARGEKVLAIFHGPHAYVSPTWYAAENVVPTWNYVAVHAVGTLEIIERPADLAAIVQTTTEVFEQSQARPWNFDPDSLFAERMLTQIIGFRIQIDSLEGKWKLSQNHAVERQQRVASALAEKPGENAQQIASMMRNQLLQTGQQTE